MRRHSLISPRYCEQASNLHANAHCCSQQNYLRTATDSGTRRSEPNTRHLPQAIHPYMKSLVGFPADPYPKPWLDCFGMQTRSEKISRQKYMPLIDEIF